jgi:nicotinate-nucleotide--dimethylbenzimidazole phosphoribosyltransferase
MARLSEVLGGIARVDEAASRAADLRQNQLTRPPGSLGDLEPLGARLAAIGRRSPPPIPGRPVVAVFSGDHGVVAEGVTPTSVEVTAQMLANLLAGGAAVNAIAREVGAAVVAVDVGVATPIPGPHDRLVRAKVRHGTANVVAEPAMTLEEAGRAMQVGLSMADRLIDQGFDLLVTGDIGVGNTTPSAALVAAVTGWPARSVTGRGTGISDEMLEAKNRAVESALERVSRAHNLPVAALATLAAGDLLAELGGLEIAALAGFILGGAYRRVPVVVDGLVSLAGVLVAAALAPEVTGYLVPGHRSVEPGATAALEHLRLEPLLDLQLGLGEGAGACLAIPVVRAAARLLNEMATSGESGVPGSTSEKDGAPPASDRESTEGELGGQLWPEGDAADAGAPGGDRSEDAPPELPGF